MTDSIAGPSDVPHCGERISFIANTGEEWLATIRSVGPAESRNRYWIRLTWDDGLVDPTRWYWPAPDLVKINA